LSGVCSDIGGFCSFGKEPYSGVISWLWETPQLLGNAATLVLRGNISLTINILFSEIVTEFDTLMRIQ